MEQEVEEKLEPINFMCKNEKLQDDIDEKNGSHTKRTALLYMSNEEESYFLTDIYPLLKSYMNDCSPCYYYSKSFFFRKNILYLFYSMIHKFRNIKYIIEIFNVCLNLIINENEEYQLICIGIISEICKLHKNDLLLFDIYKYVNVVSMNVLKVFYRKVISKVKRGKFLKSAINIYRKRHKKKKFLRSCKDSLEVVREIILSNYIIINLYPQLLSNNETFIKILSKILSVLNILDIKYSKSFFIEYITYSKELIFKAAYNYHFRNSSLLLNNNCLENEDKRRYFFYPHDIKGDVYSYLFNDIITYSEKSKIGQNIECSKMSNFNTDNLINHNEYFNEHNVFEENLIKNSLTSEYVRGYNNEKSSVDMCSSISNNDNINKKMGLGYYSFNKHILSDKGTNTQSIPFNDSRRYFLRNKLRIVKKEFYKYIDCDIFEVDFCKLSNIVNLKNSVIYMLCYFLRMSTSSKYFHYKEFLIEKILEFLKYDTCYYSMEKKKKFIENIRFMLHESFKENIKYFLKYFLNPSTYENYLNYNNTFLNIHVFILIHDILYYFKDKSVWNYNVIKCCIFNYSFVIMNKNSFIFIQNICVKLLVYIIEILFRMNSRNVSYFSLYFDIINIMLHKSNSL
ncbi:conserved Plasmodium protein, unknown function, partial [Plasmodium malariae]